MESEAEPVVHGWKREPLETEATKRGAPFRYQRTHDFPGLEVIVATSGRDPRFQCDNIGLEPAALNAWNVIQNWSPHCLISAGTCGSFARAGSRVGDVYLSDGFFEFHDHRVPLGVFEAFALGKFPSHGVRDIAAKLGLRTAAVSSGASLSYHEWDLAALAKSGAILKEMEAAAIAWVAEWFRVPCFAIKSVTNLLDETPDSAAAFAANFGRATEALAREVPRVLTELAASRRFRDVPPERPMA